MTHQTGKAHAPTWSGTEGLLHRRLPTLLGELLMGEKAGENIKVGNGYGSKSSIWLVETPFS